MFKQYYQKHLVIFKIIYITKIGCEILSTINNKEDSLYYLKIFFYVTILHSALSSSVKC